MPTTRRFVLLIVAMLVSAWPAGASASGVDRSQLENRLFERLAAATTEEQGRKAEDAIWQMWVDHPNPAIRDAVARGMRQRDSYDWDAALATFTDVIDADPDYAEGWNQRAFIYFLKEDFEASLSDLDRALQLEPRHFGALSGKALILIATAASTTGRPFCARPSHCIPS